MLTVEIRKVFVARVSVDLPDNPEALNQFLSDPEQLEAAGDRAGWQFEVITGNLPFFWKEVDR